MKCDDLNEISKEIHLTMVKWLNKNKFNSLGITLEKDCIRYTVNEIMKKSQGTLNPDFVYKLVNIHKSPFKQSNINIFRQI